MLWYVPTSCVLEHTPHGPQFATLAPAAAAAAAVA